MYKHINMTIYMYSLGTLRKHGDGRALGCLPTFQGKNLLSDSREVTYGKVDTTEVVLVELQVFGLVGRLPTCIHHPTNITSHMTKVFLSKVLHHAKSSYMCKKYSSNMG